MNKKVGGLFTIFVLVLTLFSTSQALAYRDSVVEVTQVYSTSDEVTVAVKLHNFRDLNSGSFQVSVQDADLELDGFDPAPKFDNGMFNTTSREDGDTLNISFLASGEEVDVDASVLGYITYEVDDSADYGEKFDIELSNVSITDNDDEELVEAAFDGAIYYERSLGDVNDSNELNAAQAMKILQHANGSETLDSSDRAYADIDGDGNISQSDAEELLEYIVGSKTSMARITTEEVNTAFLDVPYSFQMEAKYGQAPYTWDARRLPSGLELNEQTGVITGTPSRIDDGEVTITVEDRTGAEMKKTFDFSVIESDVRQLEEISPISVEKGDSVSLPDSIQVTYKDGTTSNEDVDWQDFSTTSTGEFLVSGMVDAVSMTITAKVIVYDGDEKPYVPEDQLGAVETDYVGFLDVHTITVDVTDKVSRVVIVAGRDEIDMNADVDSTFSLATPRLESGDVVTLVAYDYFNEKITEKKVTLR
ncbi:putative Ig domain-containing protein [Halobacillus litoralis]|uniref:putative Ig domain-containing protein n=1 Tax=Halobacillus litoralis TaxID=45668 RepID=UPI001CD35EC4|nr:putative Ig domain-containing protein [Halobacillus litoralis]MCA0971504.1 putative Ig domain-containing protein [Halobacillus litoralis]